MLGKETCPDHASDRARTRAARLKGERMQSVSATAQARGKITEIELQIIQIDQDLSSEVAKELREVDKDR